MLGTARLLLYENVATWLLGGINDPMESLTVSRARRELGSVLENHDVLAVKPRLQFLDAVHVHDGRAMHTHEAEWCQPFLELLQRNANRMRLPTHVHLCQLAVGLDPVDIGRFDEQHFAAGANHQTIEWAAFQCTA